MKRVLCPFNVSLLVWLFVSLAINKVQHSLAKVNPHRTQVNLYAAVDKHFTI